MKKNLLSIHRYLGLLLAAFLVVAGISGSILAFYDEFNALLNPAMFRLEQPGQAAQSPGQLVAAVEAWDPRVRVTYLPVVARPQHASVFYIEPIDDPATGEPFDLPFDEVFVNPVTGEVTGARVWGECCGRENWVPLAHKLHNRMFLPSSIGRPIWGTVALLWSVMAVIGLWLSFPDAKPFLRRWKAAWKVKRGLPALQTNFQLHRATGLWFWLMILPVALTGIALGLNTQLFQPAVNMLSPLTETVWDQPPARTSADVLLPDAGTSFDRALQQASAHVAAQGLAGEPLSISYSHSRGMFRLVFGRPDHAGPGLGEVYVHAASGEVAGSLLGEARGLGDLADATYQSIHGGDFAGLPGRILVFLTGLAVALLSVTGVYVWWKRRRKRLT